jgi:hypothetical protein
MKTTLKNVGNLLTSVTSVVINNCVGWNQRIQSGHCDRMTDGAHGVLQEEWRKTDVNILKRSVYLCTANFTFKEDRQCTCNVPLWRIRMTVLQSQHSGKFCVGFGSLSTV